MLLRHVQSYCETAGSSWRSPTPIRRRGGIKTATLLVNGEYAFGFLKAERACTGWYASARSIQ